jgi:hypothetical protein
MNLILQYFVYLYSTQHTVKRGQVQFRHRSCATPTTTVGSRKIRLIQVVFMRHALSMLELEDFSHSPAYSVISFFSPTREDV